MSHLAILLVAVAGFAALAGFLAACDRLARSRVDAPDAPAREEEK